jgi:hypothetical protein
MKTAAAWLRSLPIGLLDRHQGLAPVHARRKCLCRSVHSEMRASGHQHDLPAWRLPTARQRSMHGLQTDRIPQLSGTTVGYLATNRASAPGRVWGVTNGRFVEAKQEKRCLAVRLLCGDPAGRFGSLAGPHERPLTGIGPSFCSCEWSEHGGESSRRTSFIPDGLYLSESPCIPVEVGARHKSPRASASMRAAWLLASRFSRGAALPT